MYLSPKPSSSPTMGDYNKYTQITGSDSTGPITQNRYCTISAVASIVNISQNAYTNIKMDHCKSQVISCSYVGYEGKEDELILKEEAYLKLYGSKNKGSFIENKYVNFMGASNEVIFKGNKYVDYTGSHGKVKAESNKYLQIEGDNNMIQVEGTIYHHLRRHQSATTEIVVEPNSLNGSVVIHGNGSVVVNGGSVVINGGNVVVNGVNVNGGGQSYKVLVGYPKEATIRGNSYSIGVFQFLMDNRDSPSVVKLRLQVQGDQAFEIKCDEPGKCSIIMGAGEELVVKGPRVTKADDDDKTLYIHLDGTGQVRGPDQGQ